MRSRYSAYCRGEVDYLVATTAVETRDQHPAAAIRDWNRGIEWLALQINETAAGKPADTGGTVDFTAIYRENGRIRTLRELSRFVRKDGNWYYLDGVHKKAKLDRNQPCPCGSGRKLKKCCGQATSMPPAGL